MPTKPDRNWSFLAIIFKKCKYNRPPEGRIEIVFFKTVTKIDEKSHSMQQNNVMFSCINPAIS